MTLCDQIKDKGDCLQYCRDHGIKLSNRDGKWWRMCPPWRPDSDSGGVAVSNTQFTDHITGESGSIIDLCAQHQFNGDAKKAIAHLADALRIDRKDGTGGAKVEWWQKAWNEAGPDDGRIVKYLTGRGIPVATAEEFAGTIRLHRNHGYSVNKRCTGHFPVMMACVTDVDGGMIGIHRTYLAQDGATKADTGDNVKKMGGKSSGGTFRIGDVDNATTAGVGEGIETSLAVYDATGLPMFAALSSPGIKRAVLPENIRTVHIFADADSAGRGAAASMADRLSREGRTVHVIVPETTGADWLDVHVADGPDEIMTALEHSEPWTLSPDGRSVTSPQNAEKSGRDALDIAAIADEFADTRRDDAGRILDRYYRQRWYRYAAGYQVSTDDDIKIGAMAWIRDHYPERANRNCLSNVIENLKATNLAGIESLTPFPCWLSDRTRADDWLVTSNRAVNVRALARGEDSAVRELTPDLFTTSATAYDYDPAAECPMWLRYISDIQPDEAGQSLLQLLCGLSIIQDTSFNVFFILYGDGGCGKSVFLHVLRHLVGIRNVCCLPVADFADKFKAWQLADHSLNIVGDMPTESEHGRNLYGIEGMLKDVTDGGLIPYEQKHKNPQNDRTAKARCIFSTNSLPRFTDRSNAVWDRLRIIPFDQRFRGTAEDNPRLRDDLLVELPGIFNWAISGLSTLLSMKQFPEHPDGGQAKSSHRERCDKERLFLEESYERGDDSDFEESKDVYRAYRDWCTENGHRAMSEGNFADAVQRVFGLPKVRTRKGGVQYVVYKHLKTIRTTVEV